MIVEDLTYGENENRKLIDEPFVNSDSSIHRIDPRARFIVALAASIIIAAAGDHRIAAGALAFGLAMVALAGLPAGPLLKRMAAVNIFMLMLLAFLPLSVPGKPVFSIGRLVYSLEGLEKATLLALKANGIVAVYTSLVSSMPLAVLGHVLSHFRLPRKLILLYLLMIRYIHTLHEEYLRLRKSMRTRCFRPRTDIHTMATFGRVVAILLLRGFHRSHRVLDAMKCRCWRGEYWLLDHFVYTRRDLVFSVFSVIVLSVLSTGFLV